MKRRQLVSLLGAAIPPFAVLSARAGPADGCGVPSSRDDSWRVAAIDDDKLVHRAALCEMGDRLAASSEANIHVLVARGGTLVYERYFKGSDEIPGIFYSKRVENVTFNADTLHNVKSVSKSVASLTVGIALDRGLIRSVDEPIFNFFPELVVKTAIAQASRIGAEAGPVARSALEGVREGASEAGVNAVDVINASAKSALSAAREISALAVEAVRQVVVGSAQGIAEVVKSHRAAPKPRRTNAKRVRPA